MSVLRHPSPGSRSGIGLMDASDDELRGHGLFHQDHGQLLCGWGDSTELPTTGTASTLTYGALPAPTSENLLATAGVGRGSRGQRQPSTPTAPGICQTRPTAPQQRTPTPRRQETNQVTPYRQQVYLPRRATGVQMTTPKSSTAPSTSQGCSETARESEDGRGRSSSQGPQG